MFYLSPADRVDAIQHVGVDADADGRISAFTDMLVANDIAKKQARADRYAVFNVLPEGVTGEVVADDAHRFTRPFQRFIRQQRIAPEHLRLIGVFDTIYDCPTMWDYCVGARLGRSRHMVDQQFAIMLARTLAGFFLSVTSLS